jgi:hypothetical protein
MMIKNSREKIMKRKDQKILRENGYHSATSD